MFTKYALLNTFERCCAKRTVSITVTDTGTERRTVFSARATMATFAHCVPAVCTTEPIRTFTTQSMFVTAYSSVTPFFAPIVRLADEPENASNQSKELTFVEPSASPPTIRADRSMDFTKAVLMTDFATSISPCAARRHASRPIAVAEARTVYET